MSPSCTDAPHITHDSIPIGAIPLLAASTPEYKEAVAKVVNTANQVYHDFIKSEEGRGFSGQICIVGEFATLPLSLWFHGQFGCELKRWFPSPQAILWGQYWPTTRSADTAKAIRDMIVRTAS